MKIQNNEKLEPTVSVIMNCYNGEKYLFESINSLISQTYKNWELIFWDNLSTDNSRIILEKFSDQRIKYFSSEKFVNLYEARNLAIEKAKGKYISFLDTDDLWIKDKLEKQIYFLEKNKEFEIVYSNYYILEEKKNKRYLRHKTSLPSGFITQELLNYYSITILTAFLKKSIFEKFKFDNNYNVIGDFDFFINISQKFKIASIEEPLASYRVHSSNFSTKRIKIYVRELSSWINFNEKKLSSYGYTLKEQKFFLTKLKIKSFFQGIKKFLSHINQKRFLSEKKT
tara:strand:- start:432 stop:1283 length:852 start_codon:yes stop_codon:yes gene_type:complete